MKRLLFTLCLLLNGLPTANAQWDLAKNVVEYTLPNGMRWLLVQRPTPSVFAGAIEIRAGGVDETPPKVGLAHMFEHMAFKGSREIGTTNYAREAPLLQKIATAGDAWVRTGDKAKQAEMQALQQEVRRYQVPNELFVLLTRSGARDINAYTTKDATQYHSEIPTTQMPLWLYLYSGMVGDPVLREFYPERDVVQEERRMRVENSPHGKAYQALIATAFTASPYHYSTIGSAEQIAGLSISDAVAFHNAFYHPDRMVGALVGDIPVAQAKALIARFFGKMPRRSGPREKFSEEPSQTSMRRARVDVDSAPFFLMGYHKPKVGTPEDYVFDVIDYILCEGATSRLRKALIIESKLAQNIACSNGIPGSRLDNLYYMEAFPSTGHKIGEVEARILAEIDTLAKRGITDEELHKARNNLAANFLWEMASNSDLAELLVTYQALTGDWRYVITHARHIEAVTNDDVKRVAQRYLIPENLTVVTAE